MAYYRALGCGELFLFFDDARDPAFDWAQAQPGVTAVRCDAAHWASQGGKPESHEHRQWVNSTAALRRARSDWIIHLDADEYLWPRQAIGEGLARAGADRLSLRVEPVEAVFASLEDARSEFNTELFRRPIASEVRAAALAQDVHGPDAEFFRAGLLGHVQGKRFVRCSPEVTRLGVHDIDSSRPEPEPEAEPGPSETVLLHYDAISFGQWCEKMSRRAYGLVTMSGMGPKRQGLVARFAAVLAEEGEAGLQRLFANLYVLDEARRSAFREEELMRAPSPAELSA